MQFGLFMLHNPVEVAHRIAMLDHLARGRFYWGSGSRGRQRRACGGSPAVAHWPRCFHSGNISTGA